MDPDFIQEVSKLYLKLGRKFQKNGGKVDRNITKIVNEIFWYLRGMSFFEGRTIEGIEEEAEIEQRKADKKLRSNDNLKDMIADLKDAMETVEAELLERDLLTTDEEAKYLKLTKNLQFAIDTILEKRKGYSTKSYRRWTHQKNRITQLNEVKVVLESETQIWKLIEQSFW